MAKTAFPAFKHLTARQIIATARQYDLSPRDQLVIISARQADENHGTQSPCVSWGTDQFGAYQADRLLDGYLCEETRAMRADAGKARQFERDAYGA